MCPDSDWQREGLHQGICCCCSGCQLNLCKGCVIVTQGFFDGDMQACHTRNGRRNHLALQCMLPICPWLAVVPCAPPVARLASVTCTSSGGLSLARSQHRAASRFDMSAGLQGRVWAGQAALGEKLVDVLGGLTMAKNVARKLAGLGEPPCSSSTGSCPHSFCTWATPSWPWQPASAGHSMLINVGNEAQKDFIKSGSAASEEMDGGLHDLAYEMQGAQIVLFQCMHEGQKGSQCLRWPCPVHCCLSTARSSCCALVHVVIECVQGTSLCS